MTELLQQIDKKITKGQRWILDNCQYLTIMGSQAYDVSQDTSDLDVYGFTIPPEKYIYPEHHGFIYGLDDIPKFEQFQIQNEKVQHSGYEKQMDLSLYGIVRYFRLCGECNPNMTDSLFTKENNHLYVTQLSSHVILNRKLFLSKLAKHKFLGYSHSQIYKLTNKTYKNSHKRKDYVDKYGFDTKAGYHVIRLMDEIEQILEQEDIDLTRAKEHMKAVRRGDVTIGELKAWFEEKSKSIEIIYVKSTLRHAPDWDGIKKLLNECLEIFFGNMKRAEVSNPNLLEDLKNLIRLYE